MSKVIGIDLGTTNSCVATIENGEPVVIPNAEGARTTPSVVAFAKDGGERLIGVTAKRQAVTNADRTMISVKRHMGTKWTTDVDDTTYTPQEVSAFILQKLKADAEAYLGHEVKQAVITCPAYFTDAPTQSDERCWSNRWSRGVAHHQRANRCCTRLRCRQDARPNHLGVRPWWRNL